MPSDVFVNGCSAGGYGAIFHAPAIADQYPMANVAVMADASVGIIGDMFFQVSLPNWDAVKNLPNIPRLQTDTLSSVDLYAGIANAYPNVRFAQYTTTFDSVQASFLAAMGAETTDWPALARAALDNVATDATSNFRYYAAGGPIHCITVGDGLYAQEVNGVRLIDWLTQFATGTDLPETNACQGNDCFTDVLCDACATTPGGFGCGACEGWPADYMDTWPPMMP